MTTLAIHQFHSGAAYGDGVTNAMLYLQKLLRNSGYRSEIYGVDIEPEVRNRVRSFTEYKDDPSDLLLVHYSLGTNHDNWIAGLKSHRILVYHNITPAHFFAAGSGLRRLVESGRARLAAWAREKIFVGQIAVSEYNALELRAWGYDRVTVIGVLVDLDHLREHPWTPAIAADAPGVRTLLFVGRMCEHKGQHDLVRMMRRLAAVETVPSRLLLVGGSASDAYEAGFRSAVEAEGVRSRVEWLGKLKDDDLYGLYRRADLYVSMSQHEGFGMPLVEAMAFDVPVLALAAGGVAATLGEGGLVLKDADPARMAAAARLILEEPALRRQILEGQRRSLARYEHNAIVESLERYLGELGFDVALARGEARDAPPTWTLEGPYDSSYSLAIVNRELARGLERTGERVAVVSRDGPGPFAPRPEFLAANPDISVMAGRAAPGVASDVALRNQYPPHVADMRGVVRGLANYAWEESGLPAAWVDEFNVTLDLVTVTSRFVAKALRDNGVRAPIAVVGNGVDHLVAPADVSRRTDDGVFRFLHVSSCFPRKGVDALLAAWAKAFDADSRVELVIKTFANPHNTIVADLAAFRRAHRRAAPIRLIEQDLDAAAMRALYDEADCVVCPSRGEGFGLPLAEAAALGVPTITTAYGGQTDFCTPETSWLCDYAFAPSRSHIDAPGSLWVEPDVDSLARTMAACREASREERARRAAAARRRVHERYTWERVASATREAVQTICRSDGEALRVPRIGWVSTWNSRCGIATYSESLTVAIEPERLSVFADRGSTPLGVDPDFVERCWTQGWEDRLDDLYAAIAARSLDAVVIQFNFGFFDLASLARLAERLKADGSIVCLCLHATADVFKPERAMRLVEIARTLAKLDRLLVHSAHDLNRLKAIGLVDNATLFPHGLPPAPRIDRAAARAKMFPEASTVIASFGFLLPHKGVRQLIRAFAVLRKQRPNARLLLLNALYPVGDSRDEHEACRAEIAALGLEDEITLVVDFLSEADALVGLAAADVVVYPYQNTQESASGAIRLGLSSLTPVARTALPIFDDVAEITYELPGTKAEQIAAGLARLLDDRERLGALARAQARWVDALSWPRLSLRLANLIRGEAAAQRSRGAL